MNKMQQCRYGMMMYNSHDTVIGRSLKVYGEWAQREMDLLKEWIAPGDVVIDVGAYIGTHTLFFARAVSPGGRVIAVEPQRLPFQILCGNIALNSLSNVYTYMAAAGRESGTVSIPAIDYEQSNNFSAFSLLPILASDDPWFGEEVPVMTLDGLKLQKCKLIKIDVEGMEADVLRGSLSTIQKLKPILYVENNNRGDSTELVRLIRDLGYDIWIHTSPEFNPDNFLGESRNISWNFFDINMICLQKGSKINAEGLHPLDAECEVLHRLHRELAKIVARTSNPQIDSYVEDEL